MDNIVLKTNSKLRPTIKTFDSLSYTKNELVLNFKKKEELKISFSKLEKVYIKKHKLNPFVEFISIAFPFIFVLMAINYLPFYSMILVSIMVILPVILFVVKFSWYRFYVRLEDGTIFRKKINLKLITENFSTLEKIKHEYLYFNASVQ